MAEESRLEAAAATLLELIVAIVGFAAILAVTAIWVGLIGAAAWVLFMLLT